MPRPFPFVRWIALAAVWCAAAEGVGAAPAPGSFPKPVAPVAARSLSGQFIVYGEAAPPVAPGRIPKLDASDDKAILKADWLAVGAERVKAAVLREFGATDQWRGRIHLYLRPRKEMRDAPIRIVPVPFRDGWQFRVEIPDEVEWPRLVRGLVEAVLLEASNREAGEHAAQPPLWLSEGVAGIVMALHGRDLVPQGQTAVTHSAQRVNVVGVARARLNGASPLLFGELSFPTLDGVRDPAAWARFQGSSMLLVHELLGDDAGRAAMRDTLRRLPRVLNWQTAFLQAHPGKFLTLLEVEKWWAVNSSFLLARDPALVWDPAVAGAHLASLMREPADLPGATNGPVVRGEVPLSRIVLEWDFEAQRPVVARKINQLRRMYQVAPASLVPLVMDYHQALSVYVDARQGLTADPLRRAELEPRAKIAARRAARRLEELDARLAKWRGLPPAKVPPPGRPAG
ncbi:MAG: hypothetical protein DVB31_05215 [Verrucomicrobia bacterium]|nr:MAG: hypothetical protein DVB31_05215 [Verrucomicrobiota bacterium]